LGSAHLARFIALQQGFEGGAVGRNMDIESIGQSHVNRLIKFSDRACPGILDLDLRNCDLFGVLNYCYCAIAKW